MISYQIGNDRYGKIQVNMTVVPYSDLSSFFLQIGGFESEHVYGPMFGCT